jgi:hypothetical protein
MPTYLASGAVWSLKTLRWLERLMAGWMGEMAAFFAPNDDDDRGSIERLMKTY